MPTNRKFKLKERRRESVDVVAYARALLALVEQPGFEGLDRAVDSVDEEQALPALARPNAIGLSGDPENAA